MATKTFKIGEYCKGGVITVETTAKKVAVIAKDWDFSAGSKKGSNQSNAKEWNRLEVSTTDQNIIYGYPTSSRPYEPVYNVKKKLPLFAKSAKSKSQYCAGHYVIQFRKGWVKSFCPKLITLERYPYAGPFKTEAEMKAMLNSVNKS